MNDKNISSKRLLAALIDQLLVGFISGIIGFIIGFIYASVNHIEFNLYNLANEMQSFINAITIPSAFAGLALVVIWFTIIPLFNKSRASVGKLIMGLKVVKEDDSLPGFKELLIRNIRLYIEVLAIIITVLQSLGISGSGLFSFLMSFVQFGLYIYIIIMISNKKTLFYDSLAKTKVVDKMYDPNISNYQTVEEVKDWADVKGLYEQKNNQQSNVEYNDPDNEKDIDDKDYWN